MLSFFFVNCYRVGMATFEIPSPDQGYRPITREQEKRWDAALQEIFSEANMVLKRKEEVAEIMARTIERYGIGDFLREYEKWAENTEERTDKHSMRTAAMMVDLALERNMKNLEEIAAGGMLHDIGKQMISLAVLNKKGKLDPDERALVDAHPIFGIKKLREDKRLVSAAGAPVINAMIIGHHAAKKDHPYPFNLADVKNERGNLKELLGFDLGEWDDDMADAAMIAAVADVFDAMAHDRPYQKGLDTAEEIFDRVTATEDLPENLIASTTDRFFKKEEMAKAAAA
jgi:HD-GYP domain-containing protein (c-di-GMP phosphodiesterase class II)